MIETIEKEVYEPINLGSGEGTSVKELVEVIIDNLKNKPEVIFDQSKPSGDKLRILDTTKAKSFSISPKISLKEGIKETVDWYSENKDAIQQRTYNAFKEND